MLLNPLDEFAAIATISPDKFEARPQRLRNIVEQELGPLSVLNSGGMHHHMQQIAHWVHQDCRLRSFTFLALSKPCSPPTLVVFTLWLSTIARLGYASRPAATRPASR